MSPAPQDDTLAEIGARLVAAVEATPNVRLWVAPPFDRLPPLPHRPPAGTRLSSTAVHLHLAVATVDIGSVTHPLGKAVAAALASGPCRDAEIHLHVDRIEGLPAPAT
jgi:hypothetical protein